MIHVGLMALILRVKDEDNLLEMPDDHIHQLKPMPLTNIVCTCDTEKRDKEKPKGMLSEADCSTDKSIICDVVKTKPLQKNTCYAKRMRRSLQTRLSFIPDNFVHHSIRQKARFFFYLLSFA